MKQPLPCADMRFDLVVAVAEHPLPLVGYTTAPVSRSQSQTPSWAPANASLSRSSLSLSASSARLRSVTSRTISAATDAAGSPTTVTAILQRPRRRASRRPRDPGVRLQRSLAAKRSLNRICHGLTMLGSEQVHDRPAENLIRTRHAEQVDCCRIDENRVEVSADQVSRRETPPRDRATIRRVCLR